MTPDRALAPELPRQPEIACTIPRLQDIARHSSFFFASEFLLLFFGVPLALYFHIASRLPPLPVLWVIATYCLTVLVRDPTFDRRQLWNTGPFRQQFPQILALFLTGAAIVTILVRQYAPDLFLILLRTHPRTWAAIMAAYPVFSVYPQGLIYRAFLFHRYRPLLENGFDGTRLDPHTRSTIMIAASAATFALMHILFHNWIALALTFPGGILFALRYSNTRSLATSSFEHALYGCFLFTIGLGQYFYVRVV